MKNETVQAEVVESKKYKRPELFFGIGQSQSGRWIALGDFASREKANNYMRGETDYANISIVRVPQEDETAIDWKKRAVELARAVMMDKRDAEFIVDKRNHCVQVADAILKDAGAA